MLSSIHSAIKSISFIISLNFFLLVCLSCSDSARYSGSRKGDWCQVWRSRMSLYLEMKASTVILLAFFIGILCVSIFVSLCFSRLSVGIHKFILIKRLGLKFATKATAWGESSSHSVRSCRNRDPVRLRSPPMCIDRHELCVNEPVHKICSWPTFGISKNLFRFSLLSEISMGYYFYFSLNKTEAVFMVLGCIGLPEKVQYGKSFRLDGVHFFAVSVNSNRVYLVYTCKSGIGYLISS